jgi:hypothetical protein
MGTCAECGHAHYAPALKGRRSGLCAVCRLKKSDGGRPGAGTARTNRMLEGDEWLPLQKAARILGLPVEALEVHHRLIALGAVKLGEKWLVARAALAALVKESPVVARARSRVTGSDRTPCPSRSSSSTTTR